MWVACNERQAFYARLSNEQAIKWIAMMKRQRQQFAVVSKIW